MTEQLVADPYVVLARQSSVREADYAPDRHELPLALKPIRAGQLVGLYPTAFGYENVESLDEMDELWMVQRVGIVRQDYDGLEQVRVYIARTERSSDVPVIYVMLKPESERKET